MHRMRHTSSPNRKTDQETQSPVLRLFKDMMNKERDPEKANLLREKIPKMRRYNIINKVSGQGQRSDASSDNRRERVSDTTGTELYTSVVAHEIPPNIHTMMAPTTVQQQRNSQLSMTKKNNKPNSKLSLTKKTSGDKNAGGKKGSQQSLKKKKTSATSIASEKKNTSQKSFADSGALDDESCSCVSCAVQKMLTTRSACCMFIFIIIIMGLIISFMMGSQTGPYDPCVTAFESAFPHKIFVRNQGKKPDSQIMKDKILSLKDSSSFGEKNNYIGRNNWADSFSSLRDTGISSYRDTYNADPNLSDLSGLPHIAEPKQDNKELTHLKDFYKKLMQTDEQIKNLRKMTSLDYSMKADRRKRSLRYLRPHYIEKDDGKLGKRQSDMLRKFNIFYPPAILVQATSNNTKNKTKKNKRSALNNEPQTVLIQKKHIMIRYEPNDKRKKVVKCTHLPKDLKSHEKEQKHPFYKNTQRLDELLNQFASKNVHEILHNPSDFETLLKNRKNQCKHNDSKQANSTNIADYLKSLLKATTKMEKHLKQFDSNGSLDVVGDEYLDPDITLDPTTETASYDVVAGASDITNPESSKQDTVSNYGARNFNARKLLQTTDDDNFGYEEIREILEEFSDIREDVDKNSRRMKRVTKESDNSNVPKTPTLTNTNWEVPMPLYPDELNIIIKQAVLHNFNKASENVTPEYIDKKRSDDLNDLEYIEDYSNYKYEKLAQAYSDYGVLEDKKPMGLGYEKKGDRSKPDSMRGKESRYGRRVKKDTDFSLRAIGTEKSNETENNVEATVSQIPNILVTMSSFTSDRQRMDDNFSNSSKPEKKRSSDNASMVFNLTDEIKEGYKSRVLSRVLLSIEEKTDNSSEPTIGSSTTAKPGNVAVTEPKTKENATLLIKENVNNTDATASNISSISISSKLNKTINKRSATDDSGLIFWNNIYDDEYGVNLDLGDDSRNDKNSLQNLGRKSGSWIQSKIRNIADTIRSKEKGDSNMKLRREIRFRKAPSLTYNNFAPNRIYKRETIETIRFDPDNPENENQNDFAALTVHMKNVLKTAARAVENTQNEPAKDDNRESEVATSLMQQLVRLMNDLVNFQVEQKTCIKLPNDLERFLDWLTTTKGDSQMAFKEMYEVPAIQNHIEEYTQIVKPEAERLTADDAMPNDQIRGEWRSSLDAVQDLLTQFSNMSDEDKSKMTGVKEYLESQVSFLTKQLQDADNYIPANQLFEMNPIERYKRNLSRKIKHRPNIRRRYKRKYNRYMKKFVKKHTRTTQNYNEDISESTAMRFEANTEKYRYENEDGVKTNKKKSKDIYLGEDAKKAVMNNLTSVAGK